MLAKNTPKPPDYLRPETRQWFASDYELSPHHVRLLTLAAEAWDRGQQARELLAEEGITVPGREGSKPHAGISIERDARISFARLIAQLSLSAASVASSVRHYDKNGTGSRGSEG